MAGPHNEPTTTDGAKNLPALRVDPQMGLIRRCKCSPYQAVWLRFAPRLSPTQGQRGYCPKPDSLLGPRRVNAPLPASPRVTVTWKLSVVARGLLQALTVSKAGKVAARLTADAKGRAVVRFEAGVLPEAKRKALMKVIEDFLKA